MLIVDRSVPGIPQSTRMRRLLSGLRGVPEDIVTAPAEAPGRRAAISAAVHRGDSLYIVDNLRLGLRVTTRHPGAAVVIDVGDEAASLAATTGASGAQVAALFMAQRLLECRSRGLVVRGLGHLGALAARPGSTPCCLVPDVCSETAGWTPRGRSRPGLTLGFVGTSQTSRKAPPAGWELPELLLALPQPRGVAVIGGSGVGHIRERADRLGVLDRLRVVAPVPPEELGSALSEVDVCLSTQTTNLAGQVRTTGKLVEYLAAMGDAELAALQTHSRALATALFSPSALAPLWLEKMREWGVVSA
ncbi:MAG: hypothetical protein WKF86_04750 [Acidimicrobiales bacterium]